MFLLFSPYSFLFFSVYFMFLISLSMLSNFYYFWSVMELMMLIFMGLSYTLFVSSYSQLMNYFLIQTLSSFMILVFYIYSLESFMTLAFFMKLSMFPFMMWFINVAYRFPNFILFLASTLHKVPLMLMLTFFTLPMNTSLLWLSILITTFISGFMMLSVTDFRMVLVLSSIGNNSWFILSQMSSLLVLFMFVLVYSTSLYLLLSSFSSLSKPTYHSPTHNKSYFGSFWVLSLSGMPPFPVFYIKMLVIYTLTLSMGLNTMVMLFLVLNSFMFMAYLQSILKHFIYVYSSNSHYFLKY